MDGIATGWRDFTEADVERFGLQDRSVCRGYGSDREYRFLYRDRRPELPVQFGSLLVVVEWGNRDGRSVKLPKSDCLRLDALEAGRFVWLEPEPVSIPACYCCDRGVWYQVRHGVRGVLVRDERGSDHVYPLIQPASHYYNVMTRSEWSPVLIDETI